MLSVSTVLRFPRRPPRTLSRKLTRVAELGAPVPRCAAIETVADALDFFGLVEGRVCLKARRGGYDGQEYLLLSARDLLAVIEK